MFDDGLPAVPRPRWAANLFGTKTNRGSTTVFITSKNLDNVNQILETYNDENRALHHQRLRPIYLALVKKEWCHDWPDPILLDWNWKLMSGQKRLTSLVLLGPALLDKLYPEGVGLRFEYGFDPTYRPLSDSCEPRSSAVRNRYSPVENINSLINKVLNVAFKLHSGMATPAMSDLDRDAIWELNKEGIELACMYPQLSGKSAFVNSAPFRLALSEFFKIDKKKAKGYGDTIFLWSDTMVTQARAFMLWIERTKKVVDDQEQAYKASVSFMQSYLDGIVISAPTDACWKQPPIMPKFQARPETLDMPSAELVRLLKAAGFKYIPTLIGAVRLVSGTVLTHRSIYTAVMREQHRWLEAIRQGASLMDLVRPFSASAIAAFCYRFPTRLQSITNSVEFLKKRGAELKQQYGSLQSKAVKVQCFRTLEACSAARVGRP